MLAPPREFLGVHSSISSSAAASGSIARRGLAPPAQLFENDLGAHARIFLELREREVGLIAVLGVLVREPARLISPKSARISSIGRAHRRSEHRRRAASGAEHRGRCEKSLAPERERLHLLVERPLLRPAAAARIRARRPRALASRRATLRAWRIRRLRLLRRAPRYRRTNSSTQRSAAAGPPAQALRKSPPCSSGSASTTRIA